MKKSICWLLLTLWPLGAGADVYRWTDDQGGVHFGDAPPNAQKALSIDIPVAPTSPDPEAQNRRQQLKAFSEAYEAEQEERRSAKEKAREEEAQRKRKCEQAQRELTQRTQASRVQWEDEQGKRRDMTDQERTAVETQARLAVEKWCR